MSPTSSIGGLSGAGGIQQIMQLRQQIIQRNDLLKNLHESQATSQTAATTGTSATTGSGDSFTNAFKNALDSVNSVQTRAENMTDSYDRGDTTDVAKVMLARQEAGVAFEATLQVRNKLLSAYQDIMKMGV